MLLLLKTHVNSYTKKDGTFVAAHEDKRNHVQAPLKQTDTPEFKRWFGDSKVVDAEGRPLVVYHGTTSDVSEFSADKLGSKTEANSALGGFFFAKSPRSAETYAAVTTDELIPKEYRNDNPFKRIKDNTPDHIVDRAQLFLGEAERTSRAVKKDFDSAIVGTGVDRAVDRDAATKVLRKYDDAAADAVESGASFDVVARDLFGITLPTYSEVANFNAIAQEVATKVANWENASKVHAGANVVPVYLSITNPVVVDVTGLNTEYAFKKINKAIRAAKNKGKDGVVIRNITDGGPKTDHYIAFRPNQIKSATGNNGQFDPKEADITKSARPELLLLLLKAIDIDKALRSLKERRGETDAQFDAMLARSARERPTPAQAKAGNYKKPRVHWQGLEIAIENPVGSIREGKGWRTKMENAYGYVCRTEGVDGDEVDVYLGPNMDGASTAYIVHQRKAGDWKAYDEDKVMLGFDSEADARAAYLKHYDDERFLGPITAMPVAEFVAKVKATYEKPAMIKAQVLILKGHVGAYLRGGKLVNLSGYQGRAARGKPGEGQLALFTKPASSMRMDENPYKDKHPVLDTPDLFDGATPRERESTADLVREHKRLVAVLRSPSHEDDEEEADRQERELHEYEAELTDATTAQTPAARSRQAQGQATGKTAS